MVERTESRIQNRRESLRLPHDDQVELFVDQESPIAARSLDLSSRGVRVRLPTPMPVKDEVGLRLRLGDDESWVSGNARVGRLSSDHHEAVLVFDEPLKELDTFVETVTELTETGDGTPMGLSTALEALRRVQDIEALLAVLARGAASFGEVAQVYEAGDRGWSMVIQSDGSRLQWGDVQPSGLQLGKGALHITPVRTDDAPALVVLTWGPADANVKESLDVLATEAAKVWQEVVVRERQIADWRALGLEGQAQMLDGLCLHPSEAIRAAFLTAIKRFGLNLLDYDPYLPYDKRVQLRREIEELADFREWWHDNIA